MIKRTVLFFVLCMSFAFVGYSQTIRWSKGEDLKFLDGEKSLKVVISYDSLVFDNGKKEMEFQEEIAKGYEADKPGKGTAYLEKWAKAKTEVFTPHFMKDFEGYMKKIKIKADPEAKDNKYVLIVYPLTVTPGAASFPGQRGAPSYCDFRLSIVEEANPKNEVASVFVYQVMGMLIGHDFDQSFIGRFKNCFWFCGIVVGKDIVKKKKG